MNQAQKKARFEELTHRIAIMRARQRGEINLQAMEQLRTMSSQAAIGLREGVGDIEVEVSNNMSHMLSKATAVLDAHMHGHEMRYGASAYQVNGEHFGDEIDTIKHDIEKLHRRVLDQQSQVKRQMAEQKYGPSIESVNRIQLRGPLTVSESHELINMVNEHHDLKEELGLR